MKILLSALMCMVLNASQCFATDGGPWGNGTQVSVTGTYAGVLVPIQVELAPGPPPVFLPPDNSLVLFTMKAPTTGLASGTVAVFRNGFFYSGGSSGVAGTTTGTTGSSGAQGILASIDPDSARITGIISAEFTEDVTTGTTTTTAHLEANGQFQGAKITADTNVALARIRGKASITYVLGVNGDQVPNSGGGDSGGPIQYKIKGFKQSNSTSAFGG